MQIQEIWVDRNDLRRTRHVELAAESLVDGQVRVQIDKFGLTANNVSYAVAGDAVGYWQYFPAEEEWGKVPVWGFGDVVESNCEEIPIGERLWGFFPMSSHVTLTPGTVTSENFEDVSEHRRALPALYNQYSRTANDPEPLASMEDERCLLFPLFATSFILYDYLLDNDFFGAEQLVIGSASSKTGFGLAYLLHHDDKVGQGVVGLTSPGNLDFVRGLGVYDEVVAYEDIASLDASLATTFVDMAGDGEVITDIHRHFQESVKESCIVGGTHWEAKRRERDLPGAKPRFFFAPSHIAKREKEWGRGAVSMKAFAASTQIAVGIKGQIDVVHHAGIGAVEQDYLALINNEVPPSRGLMLSLND